MGKMIYCHLNYEPFNKFKTGKKTVEMRVFDEKRRTFNVGDNLVFINRSNEAETIVTEIVAIKTFKNFEELFKNYDKQALGYAENEKADYKDLQKYYSPEEIEKYGVVAIETKIN